MKPLAILALLIASACGQPTGLIDITPSDVGPMQGDGPVPPLHFNCRCVRIPVVKSWRDLGFDIDEVPEGTRASMDGQVPETQTYGAWLKTQPASVQDEALGPKRAELFRGGMTVDRFVRDGRVVRLDETPTS